MLQRLKSLILKASIVGLVLAPLVPATVMAEQDINGKLCEGANLKVGAPEGCDTDAENGVNDLLEDVINIFSFVVGVVSVIMIIIGGLKYITSSGDSGNVQGAKNTILYAVIGLVVVALAQVIVKFVLSKATTST